MEQEIWKDVKGYEGYYKVSNLGNIKNAKTNRTLHTFNSKGYKIIMLCYKGEKMFRVHRLVAQAFLDNYSNDLQVNHKNEIRDDNRVSNLEMCNNQYNNYYSKAKKINCYDLEGNFIKQYNSIIDTKKEGFSPSNIVKVCKGKQKCHKGYIFKYV